MGVKDNGAKGQAPAAGSGEADPISRAERRRRDKAARNAPPPRPALFGGRLDWLIEKSRTGEFRFAAAFLALGFILLALSQSITHDYSFTELGFLFPFSVYDVVLAMLGLSVAIGMARTLWRGLAIMGAFVVPMAVMLGDFPSLFDLIRSGPLGEVLYLIAPTAVVSAGIVLWLPAVVRDYAAMLSAFMLGFTMSLFVGLDDIGIGIPDFTWATVLSSIWIMLAPGLFLRQVSGPWLMIPARIVGSWLVVIAVVVTASLYVPDLPFAPPPPDLGGSVDPNTPDPVPDLSQEPQP